MGKALVQQLVDLPGIDSKGPVLQFQRSGVVVLRVPVSSLVSPISEAIEGHGRKGDPSIQASVDQSVGGGRGLLHFRTQAMSGFLPDIEHGFNICGHL